MVCVRPSESKANSWHLTSSPYSQSCIKGHRSSSCNHTDRPLFEIRKKGRPATQCDACRDLRRTKKLHVKCVCAGRKDPEADVGPVQIQSSSSAASSSRKGGPVISAVTVSLAHSFTIQAGERFPPFQNYHTESRTLMTRFPYLLSKHSLAPRRSLNQPNSRQRVLRLCNRHPRPLRPTLLRLRLHQ